MKVSLKYPLERVQARTDAYFSALAQGLRDLVAAVNSVAFGPVTTGAKPGNLDAVWVTVTFGTANTSVVVAHQLGRVPAAFLEAKTIPVGTTALVTGEVSLAAADTKTVTVQCTGANKVATLLLF